MKDEEYTERCLDLADNSPCKKARFGAVIVFKNKVIGKGYNHPVSNSIEEELCEPCIRLEKNIKSGTRLELCAAVHAEQAAIVDAYKNGNSDLSETKLYVAGKEPVENGEWEVNELGDKFYCNFCSRLIKEAGIPRVVLGGKELALKEVVETSFEAAKRRNGLEGL